MTNLFKEQYGQIGEHLKVLNKELISKKEIYALNETKLMNHLTALEILFMLRTSKINDKRDKIVSMINIGCQDIFERNYELKIVSNDEMEESNLKEIKYHIILFKNDIEVARNEKLLQSSGGGVLSVISVLIKIIINLIYSKEKFFIFDESMTQVSEMYQPRLSAFIKKLCDTQGITLVLITHMPTLAEYADYIYHFEGLFDKDGVPLLHLSSPVTIKEYPHYSLSIKNFQSIKEMDLIFKGFTVIKGNNDIGKSAIVRAINSVLYNDFQDGYVRFNKGRFERCEIQFQKKLSDTENSFDIKIEKTPTGLVYFINGEEMRGKSLSKDAIAEELDKHGFGSILNEHSLGDFSVSKRNKIGNIAITGQNDQLYLLDNTNSENNKIISYIFQASTINNGILKIKNIIKEIKKENKFFEDDIVKIEKTIAQKESEKGLYYLKYCVETLENYTESLNNIHTKEKELSHLKSIKNHQEDLWKHLNLMLLKMKVNIVKLKEKEIQDIVEKEIALINGYKVLNEFHKKLKMMIVLSQSLEKKKIIRNNHLKNVEAQKLLLLKLKMFKLLMLQTKQELVELKEKSIQEHKNKVIGEDSGYKQLLELYQSLKLKKEKYTHYMNLKEKKVSLESTFKLKKEGELKLIEAIEEEKKKLQTFKDSYICSHCQGKGYHLH